MSIPANEIGALLQSGAATMTPATAAIAAENGVPFAFPATPGAPQAFAQAIDAQGGTILPPVTPAGISGTQAQQQSDALFNQYLSNNGGAQNEQNAGIAAPKPQTQSASAFSWLDPWPWLKSEGLNILLIIVGVVTVIIVVTALFRGAANSEPARYAKDNAGAALRAAKKAKESVAASVASDATDLAVLA